MSADADECQRREQLAAFVVARRAELVRVAANVLGSAAEAEDIVQDTLTNLWRMEQSPEDLEAYVFRAVRLNALKRRERRRSHLPLESAAEVAAPQPPPGSRVDPLAMERAIARLPLAQQAVVRMRYYLGLSLAEVARALSISSNTAASRCRYALGTLKRVLRRR